MPQPRRLPLVVGLLALLSGLTLPSPAPAQSAVDRGDARCLLVSSLAAQNPAQREAAVRGQFHYAGRLIARGAGARMGALMIAEAKALKTPQQLQAELARCTAELTAANTVMRDSLKQLEDAARTLPTPAVPPK